MCGIIAGSGKIDSSIIKALGCLSADRGTDSAGIAWVNKKEIKIAKIADHPAIAFSMSLEEYIDEATQGSIIIGHTRQATIGAVNAQNAHPFHMEGIAFAHNGCISNYKEFGEYEVDSQCLIRGIKESNFSKYQGSIALVWIKDNKLYAYRHNNPLFRGLLDGALYLASDDDYLKGVGCRKVRPLAEGHLYTIGGGGIIKSMKIPSPEPLVRITYPNYSGRYNEQFSDVSWADTFTKKADKIPAPESLALCVCGHLGNTHTAKMGIAETWGCMAKVEPTIADTRVVCKCSEFEGVNKPVMKQPMIRVNLQRDICYCGHGLLRHSVRGTLHTCDIEKCNCLMYKKKEKTEEEINEMELWEGYPENTPCECTHELEYHQGGRQRPCVVQNCNCYTFWPDEIFTGNDSPKNAPDLLPGWDESWRNEKVAEKQG